jgi:3-oxoacyl-[acyl-carrier-protein] synthase II
MRRVVVTGMGGVCGLGASWPEIEAGLRARRNSIRTMHEWDRYTEMNTRLGGPIDSFAPPVHWTRKQLRSMGRVSQFAVSAAELAITNAGLLGDAAIRCGATGVACGSSTGSPPDTKDFAAFAMNNDASGLNANSYVRMMPHTTAANIGIFFGAQGRIIPTSSACTSGSQAIGSTSTTR